MAEPGFHILHIIDGRFLSLVRISGINREYIMGGCRFFSYQLFVILNRFEYSHIEWWSVYVRKAHVFEDFESDMTSIC